MLALEWGMLGALLASDLFLFFLFWELMLFPMAFVIGIWAGTALLRYAQVRALHHGRQRIDVGRDPLLVLTHARSGPLTFDIASLYDTRLSWYEQTLLFWPSRSRS